MNKDFSWALLYLIALGLSFFLSQTVNMPSIDIPPQILTIASISFLVGLVWILFLYYYVQQMIFLTLVSTPILLFSSGIFYIPTHAVIGLMSIGFSVLSALFFIQKQAHIKKSTEIIQLACDILKSNPSVFLFSFFLLLAHALFTLIWISMFRFSFDFLHSPSIFFFLALMYFWTSAIFVNIEKMTIAGVVSDWYFKSSQPSVMNHFVDSVSISFGSICLASLVMGIASTLRFFMAFVKRAGDQSIVTRVPLTFIHASLHLILNFIENWTPLVVIHAGITGQPLIDASSELTLLFRRNLILSVMSSTLSRLLIYGGTLGLSAFTGCLAGSFVYQTPSYTAIGVATVIPFYLLRLIGNVVLNTMDATFICYLLDIDSNSCHCSAAHKLFS